MPDSYLKCPNCGFMKFYLEDDEQGMTFVKVTGQRMVVLSSNGGGTGLPDQGAELHCVGCAWHGLAGQLVE